MYLDLDLVYVVVQYMHLDRIGTDQRTVDCVFMGKVILFPKNRDYYRFKYGWPKFDGHLQIVPDASRPTPYVCDICWITLPRRFCRGAIVVVFLSNHAFHYYQ
jgi:hypothetical protein